MNKFLLATFILLSVNFVCADTLPVGVLKIIPSGYEPIIFFSSDLNGDGRMDYLVALAKKNEETIFKENGDAPPRPLIIFLQNVDATFFLAKRNDFVVFDMASGGQCDPFNDGEDGLAFKGKYFTVQNSVACGEHWTDYITFKYEPALKDWIFHKRISESWSLNNSQARNADALVSNGRHVKKSENKTPILFEKFRPK